MKPRLWLVYALATAVLWGVWGALIELPEKAGFPATLSYAVWALTMIPCALAALHWAGWKREHDRRSIALGSAVGFLGAGGQLLLFEALRAGPAYLIVPLIALYPAGTVMLSVTLLKERASRRAWIGIALSLPAMLMLSWQPPARHADYGSLWLLPAALVFLMWAVQAYLMKFSTRSMRAESIFAYMAATAVALVPVALAMTDFSRPIQWGFRGPYLAALIQVLNSIGALCVIYALRYGKAIIVVPMAALWPVLTIILSLALYHVAPHAILVGGMVLATAAIYLMSE
jgi:drug/metabolite transporter (DMT)-like permease